MINYLIKKNDKKWELTKEGNTTPLKTGETKRAVIEKTEDFLKGKEASVQIFTGEGKLSMVRVFREKKTGN